MLDLVVYTGRKVHDNKMRMPCPCLMKDIKRHHITQYYDVLLVLNGKGHPREAVNSYNNVSLRYHIHPKSFVKLKCI